MAENSLLGGKHDPTEVEDVIRKLQADPLAFFDKETNQRKLPVFAYDADGKRIGIVRWQTRYVIPDTPGIKRKDLLEQCVMEGKDTYIEGRGWIRNGKKAETDLSDLR